MYLKIMTNHYFTNSLMPENFGIAPSCKGARNTFMSQFSQLCFKSRGETFVLNEIGNPWNYMTSLWEFMAFWRNLEKTRRPLPSLALNTESKVLIGSSSLLIWKVFSNVKVEDCANSELLQYLRSGKVRMYSQTSI